MMYVVWYFEYLFSDITAVLDFFDEISATIGNCVESVTTLISVLPLWLSYPFYCLLVIAVLFRLSQFVPTIGGAS